MGAVRQHWWKLVVAGVVLIVAGLGYFVATFTPTTDEAPLVVTGTVLEVLAEGSNVRSPVNRDIPIRDRPPEGPGKAFVAGVVRVKTEIGELTAETCPPAPPPGSAVEVSVMASDHADAHLTPNPCGISHEIQLSTSETISASLFMGGLALVGLGIGLLVWPRVAAWRVGEDAPKPRGATVPMSAVDPPSPAPPAGEIPALNPDQPAPAYRPPQI